MKKMSYVLVGMAMLACSMKHTETDFRKKFPKNSKPVIIQASFKHVLDKISTVAKKCYDQKVLNTSTASGRVGKDYAVFHEDRKYSVVVQESDPTHATVSIKFSWVGHGTFNDAHMDSFVAVVDLAANSPKQTSLMHYNQSKEIGEAIEAWAQGKHELCPELGGSGKYSRVFEPKIQHTAVD